MKTLNSSGIKAANDHNDICGETVDGELRRYQPNQLTGCPITALGHDG